MVGFDHHSRIPLSWDHSKCPLSIGLISDKVKRIYELFNRFLRIHTTPRRIHVVLYRNISPKHLPESLILPPFFSTLSLAEDALSLDRPRPSDRAKDGRPGPRTPEAWKGQFCVTLGSSKDQPPLFPPKTQWLLWLFIVIW